MLHWGEAEKIGIEEDVINGDFRCNMWICEVNTFGEEAFLDKLKEVL